MWDAVSNEEDQKGMMEPDWEKTDVAVTEGKVKLTRYGHVCLPKGVLFEALDPDTFKMVLVRERVPVQQGFLARDHRQSLNTPLVVDFERLRAGDYDWFSIALEEGKWH
ncbi:MAG: hypothetical protein ACXADO_06915 [Candidatus Thorarchaeota archaeon]